MLHPKINLPQLTSHLESIGFEARTKLLFRRGFVDVLIADGIIPDQTPKDIIEKNAPFFRITICDETGDIQGSFNCPIEGFTVLELG